MKKLYFVSILVLVLLVSCKTTGNLQSTSTLKQLGHDEDVVLTVNPSIDRIDRVNVCLSDGEIYGTIEGRFNKVEANIVLNKLDFDDFTFFVPKKNLIVFSTIDAKKAYELIADNDAYISELDSSLMQSAGFAAFSSNRKKINGLFTTIKASYITYLTKNGISIDMESLYKNFIQADNIVLINNLNLDTEFLLGFIKEYLQYGRN